MMNRLILFRHGQSERHASSGEDFDRRLTVRGCEDSHLMGKVAAEAALIPDLVLVSSAQRAKETWDAARSAFPDAAVEIRPELYHADQKDLLRIARKSGAGSVMLVAHNPGLHALTLTLLAQAGATALEARAREDFATAAICAFAFDEDQVTALGLYSPRDHGGGGSFD
jgi:phosphohistidine phosphatase